MKFALILLEVGAEPEVGEESRISDEVVGLLNPEILF